ncbi:hypothetical protein BGZ83_011688 [Gryganskiella cystojenkinii]|nr:hypothetical protein BGZ83_011688 [Gryganskiella cystojenkinii]
MKLEFLSILLVWCAHLGHTRSISLAPNEYAALHRRADASQNLNATLATLHGSSAAKANKAQSYMFSFTNSRWKVAAIESCEVEIGPENKFGSALICPAKSAAPCTLTATFKDSQTFRDEIGVHASYSVEASGGVPGIAEVKMSATYGASYTYTQEYSHGVEVAYGYTVPVNETCTPTSVSYRLRCTGSSWQLARDDQQWDQELVCKDQTIDFKTRDKWFMAKEHDGWEYQYIDKSVTDGKLWTFKTNNQGRPRDCSDVKFLGLRNLKKIRDNKDTLCPLGYTNGKSLTAVTCIYLP